MLEGYSILILLINEQLMCLSDQVLVEVKQSTVE